MNFFSLTKIACAVSTVLLTSTAVLAGSATTDFPLNGGMLSQAVAAGPYGSVFQPAPMTQDLLAQAPVYGARCVTPVGWCPIAPQPVSTPCQCGDAQGITLQ